MKKLNLFLVLILALVLCGCGHKHEYQEEVIAPTCTEQGYTKFTCECGDTYNDKTVEAAGHKYGDWTVTKEATYTEEGEKERVCTVKACDAKETGTVERLKYPVGDVNGDGKTSAVDARMILQHVAGIKTIDDTSNLDINNDKKISAVDARVILQIVAGIVNDPIKEEQLTCFVKSFNNVKENASSVTLVTVNVYKSEEYSGTEEFREYYEAMMEEMAGEQTVNQTYTGEDISVSFPPVGATCNLSLDDVKDFYFTETETHYMVSFKVNGETNPTHSKGVGAVANIVTKEELESALKEEFGGQISAEDFNTLVQLNNRYNDVTVKATIDKATGNMIEYYVDTPFVMEINMVDILEMNMGIGTAERWTIEY